MAIADGRVVKKRKTIHHRLHRSLEIIEDGLYAITYDDGYCIVGNYTDKELVYNGMPVSAHNFIELKNN